MTNPRGFSDTPSATEQPSRLGKWSQALRDKPLVRHLSIVLVLKIVLLWLLWAAFVRGHRVGVDPAHMGSRLSLSPVSFHCNFTRR